MSFVAGVRKWHNDGLNEHFGHDPVKLFFAKALASVMVTCSSILFLYIFVFLSFDSKLVPLQAKFTNTIMDAAMIIAFTYAYFGLRKGNYDLARKIFVSTPVLGIIFGIVVTGGFPKSAVTQCIIFVPTLVYLFYGMRAGTLIAILTPGFVAALWAATHFGGLVLPDVAATTDPTLNLFLVTGIVYVLMMFLVAGYEQRQSILHEQLTIERRALTDLANSDPLTGLYNFRYLHKKIDAAGLTAQKANDRMALLYLDLNDFKIVNDTHGHCVGDEVLATMAERILECVRATDTVARIGGDEFVVVLSQETSHEEIEKIRHRIKARIKLPVHHEGITCRISSSIGTAIYPDDVEHPSQLLNFADRDMYRQKELPAVNAAVA